MPLPSVEKYGAKQCSAKSKRTKQPCKNPAAYGCQTCRYHGAKLSRKALSGTNHPQYKNAGFTKAEKTKRRGYSLMFQRLEEIGWHVDLFTEGSTKTRGRKVAPNLDLNDPDQLQQALLESMHSKNPSRTDE